MFYLISDYLWVTLPLLIVLYGYQVSKLFKSYENQIKRQDLMIEMLSNQIREHIDYIENNTCKRCKNNFKKN